MNEEISEIVKIANSISDKFELLHTKFEIPIQLGVPNGEQTFKEAFQSIDTNLNLIVRELERREG